MTSNEMEVLGRLGAVEPLPDEAFDKARVLLQAAIAVEGSPQGLEPSDRRRRRRRTMLVRGGVAAGVVAAAAAVALVVAWPGHSPKAPAGQATPSHVGSSLTQLADYVRKSAAPAGNATLVARTTDLGGGKSVTVYDLYADDGRYFFSRTESGLSGQVGAGHDLAGGLFVRETAAARLAASGDVQKAGEEMASAPDPGQHVPQVKTQTIDAADASKEPGVYHAGEVIGTDYDNYVWENSQDALVAGSGDPQVRAGVLRLIATLPDVTVTSGRSGDRQTLVLTAGADEVGAGYSEQLTIDATTGIPISFAGGGPGHPLSVGVTYQVSRVTTGDIAAGKF